MESTPFSNKCEILSDLWIQYKSDPDFSDFIVYNDLGLPLAYAVASGIVETNPKLEMFIGETWDLLLSALDITEDTGFDTLTDVLGFEQPE